MDDSRCTTTIVFLPYTARREKDGKGKPPRHPACCQILTRFLAISRWVFKMGTQHMEAMLPILLQYSTLYSFRYQYWFLRHANDIGAMMQLWMAAASVLPYTGDIGQSVVDTLLQMAADCDLLPHIPVLAWDWLKRRPRLRPECEMGNW